MVPRIIRRLRLRWVGRAGTDQLLEGMSTKLRKIASTPIKLWRGYQSGVGKVRKLGRRIYSSHQRHPEIAKNLHKSARTHERLYLDAGKRRHSPTIDGKIVLLVEP